MNAVADKLREARALIERGWTRKVYAADKTGKPVDFTDEQEPPAACFCAAGAVGAANMKWPGTDLPGMRELSLAVGGRGDEVDVIDWNDAKGRTQAEVLAAFDKAIELAEARQ